MLMRFPVSSSSLRHAVGMPRKRGILPKGVLVLLALQSPLLSAAPPTTAASLTTQLEPKKPRACTEQLRCRDVTQACLSPRWRTFVFFRVTVSVCLSVCWTWLDALAKAAGAAAAWCSCGHPVHPDQSGAPHQQRFRALPSARSWLRSGESPALKYVPIM